MEAESNDIKGMSYVMLGRYVEMRHKLNTEANNIFGITSMLALLNRCGDDVIEVDPVALGKINQMLNKNILNIWEILDDFIYLVQAQLELEKLKES